MHVPFDTAPMARGRTELDEASVNVWSDSVGAAARQLGVLAAVIAATRFASALLFGR